MAQSKLAAPVKITRDEVNSLVDKAADIIRTATDYKFILILLFLKRVSDVWKEEFESKKQELLKLLDPKKAEREAENEVYHAFNLTREILWDHITNDIKTMPENLSNALIRIAVLNKDLKGVTDKFSFLGFATQENREKLRQLIELFNQYDFGNTYVTSDILGDCYEHILRKFIPMTKKEAKQGEFYTPREVVQLLVKLLDPQPGQSIYDPACGFGGMLVYSHKYVRGEYGKEQKLLLFGQEYSSEIFGLCKLNLVTHGILDSFIQPGDSLLYPRFVQGAKLQDFDIVIANPPWNQDGYGEDVLKKADFRERYFGYPPKSWADWAWIQHMLFSSRQRVGVVLDQNALHRGNTELDIRKQVVEKDLIECIILLPPKLFYNTPSAGIIITLNRNKPDDRRGKILLINAIGEFEKHPDVRRLNILSLGNIKKIVDAHKDFKDIEGFAKVVGLDEVRHNDYDLTVALYVSPIVKEEAIDLGKAYKELQDARSEADQVRERVHAFVQRLLTQGTDASKFKPTDVGMIPEDWDVVELGDILTLEYGIGLPERERKPGPYPVYGSNGIVGYHSELLVKGPGIIVGRKGSVSGVVWSSTDFWPIDTTYYVKPRVELNLKWLYYKLLSLRIEKLSTATGVPGQDRNLVYRLVVGRPPTKEQEEIAASLSSLDDLIEKESKSQRQVERIRKWSMQELLSGRVAIKPDVRVNGGGT